MEVTLVTDDLFNITYSTQSVISCFQVLFFFRSFHFDLSELNYEGCSNMNASSFITFFKYMLRQNGKRFYKGLYATFKLVPDLKRNTVCLSSCSLSNEGYVSLLTNSMLRTYASDIDECLILR